jgi:hypothetical protein
MQQQQQQQHLIAKIAIWKSDLVTVNLSLNF